LAFDDKMWVIGGKTDSGEKNDVWSSTNGISWTTTTDKADFSARVGHQSVVFDEKMWVIGGFADSNKNDVWSSTDGISWTTATDEAAFSGRDDHQSVVFDEKIWVIGGDDNLDRQNDIWYSIIEYVSQ
jgi:dihydrofolate reductase